MNRLTKVVNGRAVLDAGAFPDRAQETLDREVNAFPPFCKVVNRLAELEDKEIPCKVGDPLYWISDEGDDGDDIPTVKKVKGGIGAIIITAEGIRVADKTEVRHIKHFSSKIGSRYAYLTSEEAYAALSLKK